MDGGLLYSNMCRVPYFSNRKHKHTNKIWEVMRFRETAGFFPPLFFDSSTVSTYFVEGEQNTAPLVNHFGMWDILS